MPRVAVFISGKGRFMLTKLSLLTFPANLRPPLRVAKVSGIESPASFNGIGSCMERVPIPSGASQLGNQITYCPFDTILSAVINVRNGASSLSLLLLLIFFSSFEEKASLLTPPF